MQMYAALEVAAMYICLAACSLASAVYSMIVSDRLRSCVRCAHSTGATVLCKAATALECRAQEHRLAQQASQVSGSQCTC